MNKLLFLPLLVLFSFIVFGMLSPDYSKVRVAVYDYQKRSVASYNYRKGSVAADKGDYATTLREWEPLAEQGHVYAQHNIGVMYSKGRGVTQDYKTAVKWFTLAAEQGHVQAQIVLGGMYLLGEDVTQDNKAAFKWFTLAAGQGHAVAQLILGRMYQDGKGVTLDYTRAHMWFNVAVTNDFDNSSKNSDSAANFRGMVAKKMSIPQKEKAEGLARECIEKNYKGCGE